MGDLRTCSLQETAEKKAQQLERRIHELEESANTLSVTAPAPEISQPTTEAAKIPDQSIPATLDATAPAASMEVHVGSPTQGVSFYVFVTDIRLAQDHPAFLYDQLIKFSGSNGSLKLWDPTFLLR